MHRSHIRYLALISLTAAPLLQAATLPDTGMSLCDNGSNVLESCSNTNSGDAATMPRQDGRFGRDPATAAGVVTKVGGGKAGFDYTKVANDGSSLASSATLGSGNSDWACTQDNLTGLMWEVKSTDDGLQDASYTYSWFSNATRGDGTANELNAGVAGTENGGSCFNKYDASTNPTGNLCDTAGYVAAVNAATLCGFDDWRLPSKRELETLTHLGVGLISVDKTYFPNTGVRVYWSATSSALHPSNAWSINFNFGGATSVVKGTNLKSVRLVRGGGF